MIASTLILKDLKYPPWLFGIAQTKLTRFWLFLTTYPPCVDIFYGITVDKKWTFLDHLQGVPTQTVTFHFALAGRNMQGSFGLKVIWEF